MTSMDTESYRVTRHCHEVDISFSCKRIILPGTDHSKLPLQEIWINLIMYMCLVDELIAQFASRLQAAIYTMLSRQFDRSHKMLHCFLPSLSTPIAMPQSPTFHSSNTLTSPLTTTPSSPTTPLPLPPSTHSYAAHALDSPSSTSAIQAQPSTPPSP